MAKLGSVGITVVLGAAILYLGANAVTGHQGLLSYVDLQAREHQLADRLATLKQQRLQLEARAARLKPGSLDLDYLDERARVELAAGDADEIVFAVPVNR